MPQRVKPVTRLVGGSLSASMTGVGVVGVTAQEVTGAGAHAVSVGVASSGSGSAVVPGAGYNLAAALAAVPFAVNLPAEPVITSEATCTTAGEITTSLAVNGRRTIVAAGTYSFDSLSVGGSDKHVLLQSGAVINLTGSIGVSGASRIRFEGGTVNTTTAGNLLNLTTSSDIQFRDTVFRNPVGAGLMVNEFGGDVLRVLFLSVDIEIEGFGLFNGNSSRATHDIIFANSRFWTLRNTGINDWCMRIQSTNYQRWVHVDCLFRGGGNTGYRSPNSGTNLYFARNLFLSGGFLAYYNDGDATSGMWFYDNVFHQVPVNSPLGFVRFTVAPTATGNEGSIVNGSGFWFSNTIANPITVTPDYTDPPAWEFQ